MANELISTERAIDSREVKCLEKEAAELLVRTAALEAVKEFEKSQKKNAKARVFQNARKLIENYNRICRSVQEGCPNYRTWTTGKNWRNYPQRIST